MKLFVHCYLLLNLLLVKNIPRFRLKENVGYSYQRAPGFLEKVMRSETKKSQAERPGSNEAI